MFCRPLPVHEGVVPGLADPHRRDVDLPQHGHDALLQRRAAGREHSARLRQFLVDVVVGQQVGRGHFVAPASVIRTD